MEGVGLGPSRCLDVFSGLGALYDRQNNRLGVGFTLRSECSMSCHYVVDL